MKIDTSNHDDYAVLTLKGEFDTFYVQSLQDEVDSLLENGISHLILNLRMVKFINSWGQDKVLWGSDFPLVKHAEAFEQLEALDLKPQVKEKLLWKNAEKVFKYK